MANKLSKMRLRDLFWVILFACIVIGWALDRGSLHSSIEQIENQQLAKEYKLEANIAANVLLLLHELKQNNSTDTFNRLFLKEMLYAVRDLYLRSRSLEFDEQLQARSLASKLVNAMNIDNLDEFHSEVETAFLSKASIASFYSDSVGEDISDQFQEFLADLTRLGSKNSDEVFSP